MRDAYGSPSRPPSARSEKSASVPISLIRTTSVFPARVAASIRELRASRSSDDRGTRSAPTGARYGGFGRCKAPDAPQGDGSERSRAGLRDRCVAEPRVADRARQGESLGGHALLDRLRPRNLARRSLLRLSATR